MTKKLVSIEGIAERAGINRNQLHYYLREGRFKAEFEADTGRSYWSEGTAEKIAQIIRDERANLKRGPGRKIEFNALKKARKTTGKEEREGNGRIAPDPHPYKK